MCEVVFVTVNPNHILQVECRAYFPVYLKLWYRDDHITIEYCGSDYVLVFVSIVRSNGLVAVVVRPIESRVINRFHEAFIAKHDSNRRASVCKWFSIPNDSVFVK